MKVKWKSLLKALFIGLAAALIVIGLGLAYLFWWPTDPNNCDPPTKAYGTMVQGCYKMSIADGIRNLINRPEKN